MKILELGLFIILSSFFTLTFSQRIEYCYAQEDSFIIVRFSHALDTVVIANMENFNSIDFDVSRASVEDMEGRTLLLVTSTSFEKDTVALELQDIRFHNLPGKIDTVINSVVVDEIEWWNEPTVEISGLHHRGFWSNVHQKLVGYSIFIPDTYHEQDSFPCEYFLGGLGNDETTQYPRQLPRIKEAIEKRVIPPHVVIWPNPMTSSWYEDGDKFKTETMIIHELIPAVNNHYKVMQSAKGRWISGFSMGGYGSLNLSFKYPELFSSVVSYSAAREPQLSNSSKIRENLQIRMLCGEDDFYWAFEVMNTYKKLQEQDIAVEITGIPGMAHNIYGIYGLTGIDGIKFHWRTLGGYNELPEVDAGEDMHLSLPMSNMVRLNGDITDEETHVGEMQVYWSAPGESDKVVFSDSSALNTGVTFSESDTFRLVLTAIEMDYPVSDTVIVYVHEDYFNLPPVIEEFFREDMIIPEDTTNVRASTNDDGIPVSGNLSTVWAFTEGPAIPGISEPEKEETLLKFEGPGDYKLTCTVNDSELSITDTLYITVHDTLHKNLITNWKMDYLEGGKVVNALNRKGVVLKAARNRPALIPGIRGNAVQFNNTSKNYLSTCKVTYPENPVSARTISLWFKTNANKLNPHVIYDEGNFNNGFAIVREPGKISAAVASSTSGSTERIVLSEDFNFQEGWTHVALVYDQGNVKLFLNGVLAGEENKSALTSVEMPGEGISIGAAMHTTAFSVAGGENSISSYLLGAIDDIRIYNNAASREIIHQITGIETKSKETTLVKGFKTWPNPVKKSLYIDLPAKNGTLLLMSMEGRLILERVCQNQAPHIQTINVENLPPGFYTLMFKSHERYAITKIIKE